MDRVFSFLLWPKREARGPWKQGRKKRGSITCRTDRANEANKMFIIWLCRLFRFWKGDRELEVRTATYGPGIDQSQHAKSVSHIIKQIMPPVWSCEWKTANVHSILTIMFKNVLRTVEDETLKIFKNIQYGPKLSHSYKKNEWFSPPDTSFWQVWLFFFLE